MNIDKLRELEWFELADMTGLGMPDNSMSAGSLFLIGILDSITEELAQLESIGDWDQDRDFEIADSSVPVYTHTIWATFVDLCAYQHDSADLKSYLGWSDRDELDITKLASMVLYDIAMDLIAKLHETLDAGDFDNTESETDADE